MVKTYYMIATNNSSKGTEIRGITNKLKKANLLYDKLIDKSDTIVMYRLTCDIEDGEVRHKECVQWYKSGQHKA